MTKTDSIFRTTAPYKNQYQGDYPRWLYVCSAGMLRSATGATTAAKYDINARSCGTSSVALIPLSVNLIAWAERIIFVHGFNFLEAKQTFFDEPHIYNLMNSKAFVMDLDDDYEYMYPHLVKKFEEDIKKTLNR